MKKEKRSVVMPFRVTPSDAEKIHAWAMVSKMDVPDYLRRVVMRGVTYTIEENEVIRAESINVEKKDEAGEKRLRHGAG